MRATGFPWSHELFIRELTITAGTILCTEAALQTGIGLNVAGGTHHAFAGHGEGFCLFNDFAVAARWLLDQKKAHKILILDLDVHQGNGTAAIFGNEDRVFTVSVHGRENYPFRREKSDLDIEMETNTRDEAYLSVVEDLLRRLPEKVKPDFVFYLAGADILETDKLGKLAISREGCRRRDELVLCRFYDLGLPVMVSMGGGYSPKITDIVEAHCNTFRTARQIWG
jgi:acetoin utilization deacetylase AcuC-like enzyme